MWFHIVFHVLSLSLFFDRCVAGFPSQINIGKFYIHVINLNCDIYFYVDYRSAHIKLNKTPMLLIIK